MKSKLKSYSFWISVAGAVGIVINNIGKFFGFSFDSVVLTEIVDSVCGVLILFGIITISKSDTSKKDDAEKLEGEFNQKAEEKETQIFDGDNLEQKKNKTKKSANENLKDD